MLEENKGLPKYLELVRMNFLTLKGKKNLKNKKLEVFKQ